jgi:demethylmenaquinone methyltransferase/2-methoxy-6-polyprenyl-1,4-benzoquinol methylase
MNVDTIDHPDKARRVRAMFDQIAPRYDLLNHVLSLNIDKLWRRRVVAELASILERPGARVLDLCCGTGDLSFAMKRRAPGAEIVGLDFSSQMIGFAHEKTEARAPVGFVLGDATATPFASSSFDAVTIAFGLRNLSAIEAGLDEMRRLLKPGGRAVVLEFSHPVIPLARDLFNFYFVHILPRLGDAVAGSNGAYAYLSASVAAFPDQRTLAARMGSAGFERVRYRNLSGGIAAIHTGERAAG